jgi:hypothetical protein
MKRLTNANVTDTVFKLIMKVNTFARWGFQHAPVDLRDTTTTPMARRLRQMV